MNDNNTLWKATKSKVWTGRVDTPPDQALFQTVQTLASWDQLSVQAGVAILGFCCDAGVKRNHGRPGAHEGPQAIRQQLARLPNIPRLKIIDAGDIVCIDDDLETAQAQLADCVKHLVAHDYLPLVLGGGHEVAWGHYNGLPVENGLGIVNIDAHFDLRPGELATSGTPFWQIYQQRQRAALDFNYCVCGIQDSANTAQLFALAEEYGVETLRVNKVKIGEFKQLDDFISRVDSLYFTICLDAFAQSIAPGVSAPQAFGLYPEHVMPIIERVVNSGKLISLDIAELAPNIDQDQQTARLGAQLLWQCLHLFSNQRNPK